MDPDKFICSDEDVDAMLGLLDTSEEYVSESIEDEIGEDGFIHGKTITVPVNDGYVIEDKTLSLKDAGKWLADKWQQLEGRYGRKGALAMALASVATFPIPGNVAAIVAAAEAIRGIRGS